MPATTVACSATELEHARRLGKARLINNGVDIDLLERVRGESGNARAAGPVTVGTSGRVCFQKNPALFVALAEAFPDLRWVWIGDGEMLSVLEKSRTPIAVTGWKDREETLRLVSGLDIYL